MGRYVNQHHVVDRLTECWSIYQLTCWSHFGQHIDQVLVDKIISRCVNQGVNKLHKIPTNKESNFTDLHKNAHSQSSIIWKPGSTICSFILDEFTDTGSFVWILVIHLCSQCCKLSRIIWETPDFEPYYLPLSRLESEISRIIAKVCHFL